MLQDINQDAALLYELHPKKDGEKVQSVLYLIEIETNGKSFEHHTSVL